MNKYKPNQERIDFITEMDVDRICTKLAIKFGKDAFSDVVGWSLSEGYRMGIERGLQMAQEADMYVENGAEDER